MRRTVFLLAALNCGFWLSAATNPIGMVLADGSFRADHAQVWGTTTLFNGTLIETGTALSRLHLSGGVDMRLGAESRATVYERRLVLDFGQLESTQNYEVQANSLRIVASGPDGLARIQVRSTRNVQVAAIRGAVRVSNAGGVLVANIEAGKTLNLEPQEAGAAAPTQATGCLVYKNGKPVIVDQTANITLELHGTGLEREAGNRVIINGYPESGAPAVAGASQVVKVAGLRQLAAGGCSAVARKIGASVGAAPAASTAAPAAAAASASGIGAGTVAVIGGVAAAAAVGGLGIVGDLPGQGNSTSVSR